jgi:alcohol dehydrogenase class IV
VVDVKKLWYRLYQRIMYLLSFFIPFKEPLLYQEDKAIAKVSKILKEKDFNKVLIVTDDFLKETDVFKALVTDLKKGKIDPVIYSGTKPNPSIDLILEAYDLYHHNQCQAMIAYGGGSAMDLAKGVGAKVVRPHKDIQQLRGTLKIRRKIPFLICIPSTVGTGSEATLAAVVTDDQTKEKYALMDPSLMPDVAILDIDVVKSLPKKLIAETGMDALTHAIEAYIGHANTKKTKNMALSAIDLVFNNLLAAYQGDLEALSNMQLAAYQAGVAFTRAYVGNVHALSHQLSAIYHLPHGYANAVILPYVLRYYGSSIEKSLSHIYDELDMGKLSFTQEKANDFISKVIDLKRKLKIDDSFNGLIQKEDKAQIIKQALNEANPLYPVPKIFNADDFDSLISLVNG